MKKILSSKFILIFLIVITSCDPFDVFEKEPLDKISDAVVWNQEALITAYVTNLYSRYPWFSYPNVMQQDKATNRMEAPNTNLVTLGQMSRTSEAFGYWNYGLIRDINVFLERIPDSPIDPAIKRRLEGEVRTMRAVIYFEKQKRYGGVPLVDVVIDPTGELPEEKMGRSTEAAIADFIDSELALAIELLGEDHTRKGLINKWVAYAYRARANLWTASIAKYGNVQVNGLVGIPSNRANEFYQKAADAARAVINSGRYQLYNEIADRAENYRELFIDNSNVEVIFERRYDGVNFSHGYTRGAAPVRWSMTHGAAINPFLEVLLDYENVDGTMTQPDFGPDNLYVDGIDLWANKDPRLHGTIWLQGHSVYGQPLEMWEGLDPSPTPDPDAILDEIGAEYQGVRHAGIDSRLGYTGGFRTSSGFLIQKYIDIYKPLVGEGQEDVNWIEIRLGEMYLTVAEAEFELGRLSEAAEALNATRVRAGISPVTASDITLERVRRERKNELLFEGHRWWDLRRWRIAEELLNRATPFQGLRTILHYETGQFYFLPMNAEQFTRVFRSEHYYNPFVLNRMDNNRYLVQNPGYN